LREARKQYEEARVAVITKYNKTVSEITRRARLEELEAARQHYDALRKEAEKLVEAAMTPLEKFRMQEARILELRKAGAFRSEEDFAKVYGAHYEEGRDLLKDSREKMMEGMPDARKRAEEILKDFGDLGEETFRTLENAVKSFGDKFTDTFTEMVTTGKASFSDLARSIIQDIIRITMYTTVTKPLSNWLVGGIESLAGGLSGGSSRASAKFADGGWLMEPIIGMGLRTGTAYTLAERGPELVVPQGKAMGGQVNNVTVNVSVSNTGARSEVSGVDAKGLGNAIKAAVLNVLAEQKRPGGMLNG
jgi:lambda family phage tail tape measure protein